MSPEQQFKLFSYIVDLHFNAALDLLYTYVMTVLPFWTMCSAAVVAHFL